MFFEFLAFILGKITFFTGSILGGGSFPKPLTSEEELECLTKMKQGDKKAEETLIKHNLRLVAHISKKYKNSSIDNEDLISIGSIGI